LSWKEYSFATDVFDKMAFVKCQGKARYSSQRHLCAIAISFPIEVLDKCATRIEMGASLTLPQTTYFVKAPYDPKQSKRFNAYDASEKFECIEEYLARELDFE